MELTDEELVKRQFPIAGLEYIDENEASQSTTMPRTLLEFNRAEEVSVDELTPQHIQNRAEEEFDLWEENLPFFGFSPFVSKHVILEGRLERERVLSRNFS